jgi:hypothetical protein
MERIDRRTLNLVPLMAAACPLMRSKVRAYSHQGHDPRADQQAGYISATSDSTFTCERQPVHTKLNDKTLSTREQGSDFRSNCGAASRKAREQTHASGPEKRTQDHQHVRFRLRGVARRRVSTV